MVLLFLISTVFAAAPQKIRFESIGRNFDLVLTEDRLTLLSPPTAKSLKISGCNKEMIRSFWKATVAEIQSLPAMPDKKIKPWFNFEGRYHTFPPVVGGSRHPLRALDAKFATLAAREKRLCGKSR